MYLGYLIYTIIIYYQILVIFKGKLYILKIIYNILYYLHTYCLINKLYIYMIITKIMLLVRKSVFLS